MRAKDLARFLRDREWNVEIDVNFVHVTGHRNERSIVALLGCPPALSSKERATIPETRLRMVALFDISVDSPGRGLGTRLIEDTLEAARRHKMLGLAFSDASAGASSGFGYWRAFVSSRPHLRMERAGIETRVFVGPA